MPPFAPDADQEGCSELLCLPQADIIPTLTIGSNSNWIVFESSSEAVTEPVQSTTVGVGADEDEWLSEEQLTAFCESQDLPAFDQWLDYSHWVNHENDIEMDEEWEFDSGDDVDAESYEWTAWERVDRRQAKRKVFRNRKACIGCSTLCSVDLASQQKERAEWQSQGNRRAVFTPLDRVKEERRQDNRKACPARGVKGPRAPKRSVCTGWGVSQSWGGDRAGWQADQQWEAAPALQVVPRCPANNTQLPDELFSLMHELQYKEINPNDFDLLMQLAEYDSRKTISESQLSAIPLLIASEATLEKCEDDSCVFCCDDFCVGDHLKQLPCGHTFHEQCITGHLSKYSTKCPYNTGVAFGGCIFDFAAKETADQIVELAGCNCCENHSDSSCSECFECIAGAVPLTKCESWLESEIDESDEEEEAAIGGLGMHMLLVGEAVAEEDVIPESMLGQPPVPLSRSLSVLSTSSAASAY